MPNKELPICEAADSTSNGPGYNGQNLAVYDCEFLDMLRH
jgi:hypothetical protein